MVVNSNDYFPMYSITTTQFSDYPAQCVRIPILYRDFNIQKTKIITNVILILRNSSSKLALKNLFSSSYANRNKKRSPPMLKRFLSDICLQKNVCSVVFTGAAETSCEFYTMVGVLIFLVVYVILLIDLIQWL